MVDKPSTVVAPRGAVAAMAWFFENSLDIFTAVQGGRLTRANGAWTRITGWNPPEKQGLSFWDFVHPDDLAATKTAISDLPHSSRDVAEHRLSTADGRW